MAMCLVNQIILLVIVGQPRIISAKCLKLGISKPVYFGDLSYKFKTIVGKLFT